MRAISLNTQILFGAILGVLVGMYFHQAGSDISFVNHGLYASELIGTLFIDTLKMILVPLVFFSITVGIANLRQHSQIHKVWVTTLVYFVASMGLAMIIGMAASTYFKPGSGLAIHMFNDAMQNFQAKQMPLPEFFAHFLHGLFVNPFKALAEGNVLSVVIFSLFLGIALVIGGERYKNILALMQDRKSVV